MDRPEKLWYLTGQKFDFRLETISARKEHVLPTIQFDFTCSSTVKQGEEEKDNLVTNISMDVSIKDAAGSHIIIGCAKSHSFQQRWSINEDSNLTFIFLLFRHIRSVQCKMLNEYVYYINITHASSVSLLHQ